jgi:hypothetical protein
LANGHPAGSLAFCGAECVGVLCRVGCVVRAGAGLEFGFELSDPCLHLSQFLDDQISGCWNGDSGRGAVGRWRVG